MLSCNSRNSENEYQLTWSDEFDYSGLPDATKWKYDTEGNPYGWGNSEAQFYTEQRLENARVENGILRITAIKESWEDKEYTSARLVSMADWKYGKIEVRAKIPAGRGTWSAIWMMPGGWTFSDGNWPDVGEFDIMEHVGHEWGRIEGIDDEAFPQIMEVDYVRIYQKKLDINNE